MSTKTKHRDIINQIISNKYVWKTKDDSKKHCFLISRDIRALVVGKSGYGKTTLLTHLLFELKISDYDTLNICG